MLHIKLSEGWEVFDRQPRQLYLEDQSILTCNDVQRDTKSTDSLSNAAGQIGAFLPRVDQDASSSK